VSWRRPCQTCAAAPVAFTGVAFCFDCWPGGPVVAPPCLACGSTDRYFTNGLCARCHRMGTAGIDSCRDCYAWGATRHRAWYCIGCGAWRQKRTLGVCRACGRPDMPLTTDGACRLCRKQRTRVLVTARWPFPDVIEANRHGQQLFFADMFILNGPRTHRRGKRPPPPPTPDVALPVAWRQQRLFTWPIDLRIRRALGFPEPPNPRILDTLLRRVDAHAERYGWSEGHTHSIRGAMRILLGLQETPGAPIRATEVAALAQLGYSVPAVLAVLTDTGMLDDDRQPPIVVWFGSQIADLPDDIRHELTVWFNVMRNGSQVPPRRLPRTDATITNQLRTALPALRHWATTHPSLREITRDHIKSVLPASGWQRGLLLGSLRSIFRVLKARQLVFANPTTHMHARAPVPAVPAPIDLAALRDAIGANDPARAALAALLAYHAIRKIDLRNLTLTDIRGGRLHIGDRTILLAEPARDCLTAYLDHRTATWPNTINPHVFINRRSATHTRAVNANWIRDTLGMPPDAVRRDRILDEAFATGGDLRQLTDLFGIHVATADRYAGIAQRATTAEHAGD
jgi:site-specific recombinase XerD